MPGIETGIRQVYTWKYLRSLPGTRPPPVQG
jgi:hypothetical protein